MYEHDRPLLLGNSITVAKTDKLTIKQKRFADILFAQETPNQRKAYIQAGYKARGSAADAAASRLLSNVKVRDYLQELRDAATEKTLIDSEKIINEYAISAFYDIADYFNEDMTMKSLDQIDPVKRRAIESIKIRTTTTTHKDGSETTTKTLEFKLCSKLSALDSLGKHFGIYEQENSQKAQKPVVIVNFADIPIED